MTPEVFPVPDTVLTPAGEHVRIIIAVGDHDQEFEASDYKELSEKLTKALTHANRFIVRLQRENQSLTDASTNLVRTCDNPTRFSSH